MGISLGFSRELSSLAYLMAGDRVTLGRTGEVYAKILLEAHGYLADIDHKRKRGDLKVVSPGGTVLRVEVKAARVGKDGYFQFCLTRRTKTGYLMTSITDCDAVVLLGITASGRVEIYVMPAKAVQHITIIKIPAKPGAKCKWNIYTQHCGNVNLNEIEGLQREGIPSASGLHSGFSINGRALASNQAGK